MAAAILLKRTDHKAMYVNPDHVVSILDFERGSCTVTLITGNSYIFNESSEDTVKRLWNDAPVLV